MKEASSALTTVLFIAFVVICSMGLAGDGPEWLKLFAYASIFSSIAVIIGQLANLQKLLEKNLASTQNKSSNIYDNSDSN